MAKLDKYKSDAFHAIHETAVSLHTAGFIELKTMQEFDRSCLAPITPLTERGDQGEPKK